MGVDLIQWALSVYWLVGLLFVIFVTLIVAVFSYAYLRSRIWQASVKRAEQKDYEQKHRPDGAAYPPASRGLCDSCQNCFEKVYFLPSGARLCENCYEEFQKN